MENNPKKGIAIMLLCSLFSSLSAAGTKYASAYLSLPVIVFVQYGMGLLFTIPILMRKKENGFATKRWRMHLFRGISGLAAIYAYYLALTRIQLVEATLLRSSSPLWVPIIIQFWLKIKIPGRRWLPLIIGFIGVVFILRPMPGAISVWHLVALSSAILIGTTMVSTRLLLYTESTAIILFYYYALAVLISLPLAVTTFQPAPWSAWAVLLISGIFLYVAMNFYTIAFQYAKPSIVSPIVFFGVALAGVWGWVFWNQIPVIWTYLGISLVVIGAIVILVQERPEDQLPPDVVSPLSPVGKPS